MSEHDVEALLRRALRPVEPPAQLAAHLESRLESLTSLAVEELDSLELRAMRDPRNWVRPVAAAMVGTTAGTALIVLRARRRARERSRRGGGPIDAGARVLRGALTGARTRIAR